MVRLVFRVASSHHEFDLTRRRRRILITVINARGIMCQRRRPQKGAGVLGLGAIRKVSELVPLGRSDIWFNRLVRCRLATF